MHIVYIIYGIVAALIIIVSFNILHYTTYVIKINSEYELNENKAMCIIMSMCWPLVLILALIVGIYVGITKILWLVITVPSRIISNKRELLK